MCYLFKYILLSLMFVNFLKTSDTIWIESVVIFTTAEFGRRNNQCDIVSINWWHVGIPQRRNLDKHEADLFHKQLIFTDRQLRSHLIMSVLMSPTPPPRLKTRQPDGRRIKMHLSDASPRQESEMRSRPTRTLRRNFSNWAPHSSN